jgi:hypothetical protein
MIYLTLKQAQHLVKLFGGDEETVITVASDPGGRGHSGAGLYAGYRDYPEEGAHFLGQEP